MSSKSHCRIIQVQNSIPQTASFASIEDHETNLNSSSESLDNFKSIAQFTNPTSQPLATSSTPLVAIFANDQSIVEGTAASFDVSRTGGDQTNSLRIELTITQMGNFIQGTAPTYVTIPANQIAWDFRVSTEDDMVDEANGKIIATIDTNARYQYNQTYTSPNQAEIIVTDNDIVKVAIFANDQNIVEGAAANFDVSRTGSGLTSSLRVELSITQIGNFIRGTIPTFMTIPTNRATWDFSVQTEDDAIDEANGKVIATIDANARYEFDQTQTSPNQAETIVTDNDEPPPGVKPIISINGSPNLTITEGESVTINVNSSLGIEAPVIVNFNVDEGANDFIPASQVTTVTLMSFQTSAPFIIQTVKDNETESTGTVNVTVITGTNYEVATSPNNTYSYSVTNNTGTPQLYITPVSASVEESQPAEFEIAALINFREVALATDLLVAISVETIGNFFDGVTRTSHTFLKNKKTSILSIPTIEDTTYEVDGTVKVTLSTGTDYELHNILPNTATIKVLDNDVPTQGISVVAFKPIITEGEYARFQITTSSVISNQIAIRISISDDTNIIFGTPDEEIILSANQRAAIFEVETVNNAVDQDNGLIILRILDDLNRPVTYTKSSTRNWASVEVLDNDEPASGALPTLSVITIGPTTVNEGENITLQFNSSKTITQRFKVRVKINENSTFSGFQDPTNRAEFLVLKPNDTHLPLNQQFFPYYEFDFPQGSTYFRHTIATDDDVFDEYDGIITAEIISDSSNYQIDDSAKKVEVRVNDLDAKTTFSISLLSAASITEGENIRFNIHTELLTIKAVTLRFDDGTGNFLHRTQPTGTNCTFRHGAFHLTFFPFTRGDHNAPACIQTVNDTMEEAGGTVTISIRPSNHYNQGTNNSISISVADNDRVIPTLSISLNTLFGDPSPQNEGGTFGNFAYNITSSHIVPRALPVKFKVEETGNFIKTVQNQLIAGEQISPLNFSNSMVVEQFVYINDDNDTPEPNSEITVTILDSNPNEYIVSAQNSVTVTVNDDDAPSGISILKFRESYIEGETAVFQITSDTAVNSNKTIGLSVTEVGNFINQTNSNHPYNSIMFRSGRKYELLEIQTKVNNSTADDGSITVTLQDSTLQSTDAGHYTLASAEYTSATINIKKLIPELSITSVPIRVTEGHGFTFTLESTPATSRELTIVFSATPSGTVVSYEPNRFTIPTGTSSISWNGNIADVTGTTEVSISIQESMDDPKKYTVASDSALSLTVLDNDNPTESQPRISIEPVHKGILAGSMALFRINVEPSATNGFDVKVNVAQMGSYVNLQLAPISIRIPPNNPSKEQPVPTVDPNINMDALDGTITMTLIEGDGTSEQNYSLADAPLNTAIVTVTDDPKPEISISAIDDLNNNYSSGEEADEFRILFMASSSLSFDYPINFSISETGDFLPADILSMTSIGMESGMMMSKLNVQTKTDGLEEFQLDSVITVTLADGNHYSKSSNSSVSVTIHDINVLESGFSIIAYSESITEGDQARFQIRSNTAVSSQTTVSVSLDDGGRGSIIGLPTRNVIFAIGERSKNLEINTTDFPNFTATGFISATLMDSNEYSVVGAKKSAIVSVVSDNSVPDLPRVAISPATSITEGGIITLNFTTTSPSPTFSFPSGGIRVLINVQQSGGNFIQSTSDLGDRTITLLSNSHSLDIPTQVVKGQDSGLVNIKIMNDPETVDRYLPADYPNAITQITINNNNQPAPTISLAHSLDPMTSTPITSVTEGDDPNVIFQLDQPAAYEFVLNYLTSEVDNGLFLDGGTGTKQQNVVVGDQNITVPINLDDDDVYELDGSILVEIADSESYNISMNNRDVEIAVEDNETAPIIVAIDAPVSVIEGEDINLTLTATSTLSTQQTIMVDFQAQNETGTYLNYSNPPVEIDVDANTDTDKSISIPTSEIANSSEGTISLIVIDGDYYDTASMTPTNVKILAKEDLTQVSFTRASLDAIEEGETAQFTVNATNPVPSGNLTVSVMVSQDSSEDFLTNTIPNSVDLVDGTGVLEVGTTPDKINEDDGTITVMIQPDPLIANTTMDATYLLGSITTASVAVKDNDDADTSKPSVTISGPVDAEEGDSLVYTVTADPAPTTGTLISVRVRISETGQFLTNSAPISSPRFENVSINDTGIGMFTLTTTHDEVDENDAKIFTRILSEDSGSATYSIGETPVQVTDIADNDDDDLPTINISAKTPTVTESGSPFAKAIFTLEATAGAVVTGAVDVTLIISEVGNFLATPVSTARSLKTVTPGTPVDHEEPIANDNVDEPNGKITAKIMASSTYSVGENAIAVVIVYDDEGVPTITIDDSLFTAAEGNPPASGSNSTPTTLVLNVGLSRASANPISVNYIIGNDTNDSATRGDDYTVSNRNGTIFFQMNDTTPKPITVTVTKDTLFEIDEELSITFSLPNLATPVVDLPSNPIVTGRITNDDMKPSVSIADNSNSEGNPGDNNSIQFTVTLSEAAGVPVKINYETTDVTAITGEDYTEAPSANQGKLFIPASESKANGMKNRTENITFNITGDSNDELDETFQVTISTPADANAILGSPSVATGTILSDDNPTLFIESKTIDENVDTVTLKVILASPKGSAISIPWTTANGTAVAGKDFTADPNTLIFDGTNTDKEKEIEITILDDSNDEDDQSFTVQLADVSGVTRLYDGTGTITIMDNDAEPKISIATVTAQEEDDNATLPNTPADTLYNIDVTLNDGTAAKASEKMVTVDFTITPDTAVLTHDYELINLSYTLTFNPGITTQQIMLRIKADNMDEPDESFDVELTTATNAMFAIDADDPQSITIIDNDNPPVFSIENVSVTEGVNSGGMFVITQTPTSGKTVSVDVTIADGTATAGTNEDYVITGSGGNTRTIEFVKVDTPADSVTQNIPFTIRDDNLDEENETFTATLSNTNPSTNASIHDTKNVGTVTIVDASDDILPTLTISAGSGREGNQGEMGDIRFTATLDKPAGRVITATITPSSEIGDTATAGTDFSATRITVEFQKGDQEETFVIKSIGDIIEEIDETFTITYSADYANTPITTAQGTILSDDMPILSIESKIVSEDTGTVTLKVKLSNPMGTAISVPWETIAGTALAGSDFTATSGTLKFDGTNTDKEKEIEITILEDTKDEDNQSFTVQLQEVTGVSRFNGGTGTITIMDNDAEPKINIETVTAQVEDNGASPPNTPADTLYNIDVTLNDGTAAKASEKMVSVDFTVTPDTAVLTHDYELINSSTTLTFDPGIQQPNKSC